ncbi:MAG TPA: DUF1858 domain-containing protein [Acholeplasmataceae bacterium]|jgi:hypothetical protein|nr:DUF1858 domain-containing protein [Acholeplasmataceae bacterium]
MQKININTPIYHLIKEHPEIKEIMISLGFKNITNPVMLNTAGKVMNLKSGSKLMKIDLKLIQDKFLEHNFILEDNNE